MGDENDKGMRESLKRVAVELKRADIPFALAGGYAGWARGGPEPGHDVDFVVPEDSVEPALKALAAAGLRTERPPEDWLAKVYDGERLVDLIHRPVDRPVTAEMLDRADVLEVDSVHMPVLAATDLILTKLLAMSENSCDLGSVLPTARALREQVDWGRVREETADSPYAAAFFFLAERLGLLEPSTRSR